MSECIVMMKLPITVAHSCGLLTHLNISCRGMFKLNTKFDADSLLYLLSHFECHSHTVHMLTQWHLLPSFTSTVKLSLFMHADSSPCSLATKLYQWGANCSHCINNGWTFSRHTSYSYLKYNIHLIQIMYIGSLLSINIIFKLYQLPFKITHHLVHLPLSSPFFFVLDHVCIILCFNLFPVT